MFPFVPGSPPDEEPRQETEENGANDCTSDTREYHTRLLSRKPTTTDNGNDNDVPFMVVRTGHWLSSISYNSVQGTRSNGSIRT